MPNFSKSLKQGNVGQKYLTDLLDSKNVKWESNKDISYDLIITSPIVTTLEVKYDIMFAKTGNLAIEFRNSRKNAPSGLSATTATYWVHILSKDEILVAKVVDLKNACATIPPRRIILGGGDKNADLYLYKKDQLYPHIFSLLNKDSIHEILAI